jgi:predicted nucleic acid-binding protein
VSEAWVINASPVILLAKAGLIKHLSTLANPLVIPEPVVAEINLHREEDAAVEWLRHEGQEFVQPAVSELLVLSSYGIGAGERSVISWAVANQGFTAVLDDYEARKAAQQLGVPVLGTVGVVLLLKQCNLIPDAKTSLLTIRRAGGFLSDTLLREALKRVGEHL